VDIASSSFSEDDAIFGGARNFRAGLENVTAQYHPDLIGVATTCLAETIGENMVGMIKSYQQDRPEGSPPLAHVSTPAYAGCHAHGYRAAVRALLETLARPGQAASTAGATQVNVLPPMMSCADLRALRALVEGFDLDPVLLPDYAETLEGASWRTYHRIAPGGTPIAKIAAMPRAKATLELGGETAAAKDSAGRVLERWGVPRHPLGWPLGLRSTDALLQALETVSGRPAPRALEAERGRVVDAYVDGHKYVAERRVAVFGEPDLALALAAFVSEIGMTPVLAATGAKVEGWKDLVAAELSTDPGELEALDAADHARIAHRARALRPELLLGSSKGYPLARELGVPLLRVGFPIHDRFGAQRHLTVGYRGTLELFDRTVNALLADRQDASVTGYSYL
jgi:nitrogenase molybdenum-iron protein NifN